MKGGLSEDSRTGPEERSPDELLNSILSTPFFMNQAPSTQKEVEENDTLAAMQSLIYDAPPVEISTNFKNHGNEAFQQGQWREAVQYYTKAIEAKYDNVFENSKLHSNRAAAQMKLGGSLLILFKSASS